MIELRSGDDRPPLFCAPVANDYGFGLRDLAKALPRGQPVYSLSFERWGGGPYDRDLVGMGSLFVEEIRKIQPQGPYHLLGWCLGGWIAFEAARQLEAMGQEVKSLVLVDSFGPAFSDIAQRTVPELLRQRLLRLHRLPLADKVRYVTRRLDPKKIAAKLLRRKAPDPVHVAGLVAEHGTDHGAEVHTGTEVLPGTYALRAVRAPIDVVRAQQQLPWFVEFADDAPDLGWQGCSTQRVLSVSVPGTRDSIRKQPAAVADVVAQILESPTATKAAARNALSAWRRLRLVSRA